MARKIGFYSIRKHAELLCKYVQKFTPVILALYPNNVALHDALQAANLACSALTAEIIAQETPGV